MNEPIAIAIPSLPIKHSKKKCRCEDQPCKPLHYSFSLPHSMVHGTRTDAKS